MTMSMRALFGWVAFAAVAAAALTQASVVWTGLVFSAAVLFTGWAILAAIVLRDLRRTFWIGAAVCSLGYFFLISGGLSAISGQTGMAGRLLVTHQLLAALAPQDRAGVSYSPYGEETALWSPWLLVEEQPTQRWAPVYPAPTFSAPYQMPGNSAPSLKPNTDSADESPSLETESDEEDSPPKAPPAVYFPAVPSNQPPMTTTIPPPVQFPTTTVGRGSRFLVTGHCLFAILFGICGGWSARRFLGSTTVENSALST